MVAAHHLKGCDQRCTGHVHCSVNRTGFVEGVLSDVSYQLWTQCTLFSGEFGDLAACLVMSGLSICSYFVHDWLCPFESGDSKCFLLI